ncbi:MAG TPA: hypothetical protein VGO31_15555, partial [Microbacteriaceae bacterium]|nr:hypothetical protein [Microbacteriaceae bacterium]
MNQQPTGTGHVFARPIRSASQQLASGTPAIEKQVFHELPPPSGQRPIRLELASVIGTLSKSARRLLARLKSVSVRLTRTTSGTGGS